MLLNSFFTGEYVISPAETKSIWTQSTVSTANFSYTLLSIAYTRSGGNSVSKGRNSEWAQSINSQAVVVTDREGGGTGAQDPGLATTSLWVTTTTNASGSLINASNWRGSVAWNDNHVTFETNATIAITKYGEITNTNDNLFLVGSGSVDTNPNITANAYMSFN